MTQTKQGQPFRIDKRGGKLIIQAFLRRHFSNSPSDFGVGSHVPLALSTLDYRLRFPGTNLIRGIGFCGGGKAEEMIIWRHLTPFGPVSEALSSMPSGWSSNKHPMSPEAVPAPGDFYFAAYPCGNLDEISKQPPSQ